MLHLAPRAQVASVTAALEKYAPPADRGRLRLAVTETGVYDYGFKWQNWQADTGHALVMFELMGTLLAAPRVDTAIHWTTHWFSEARPLVAVARPPCRPRDSWSPGLLSVGPRSYGCALRRVYAKALGQRSLPTIRCSQRSPGRPAAQAWPALDDDMPGACADTLWPNQAPTALGTAFALLARAFPGGGELLQARRHPPSLRACCTPQAV